MKEFPWKDAGLACYKCRAEAEPVRLTYQGCEVRGWRCPKCGEEMLHPEDTQLVLELKKTGQIQATVSQIGRQTVIRVPALIRDYYKLNRRNKVIMKPKGEHELAVEVTTSSKR